MVRVVIPLRKVSCPFTIDLDGGPQVRDRGTFRGLLQGPLWEVYLDQSVVLRRPTLSRATSGHRWPEGEAGDLRGRLHLPTRAGQPGLQAPRTLCGSPGEARTRAGEGARGRARRAGPGSHFRAERGGAGRPLISAAAAAAAGGARASPLTGLSRGEGDPVGACVRAQKPGSWFRAEEGDRPPRRRRKEVGPARGGGLRSGERD